MMLSKSQHRVNSLDARFKGAQFDRAKGHTGEMRFVANDLVDVEGMREQASAGRLQVLPLRDHGLLVRGHASQAPDGRRHALGQGRLDRPYGREGVNDGRTVCLPRRATFARHNRPRTRDAVRDRVKSDPRLPGGSFGSAPPWRTRRCGIALDDLVVFERRVHNAPPCSCSRPGHLIPSPRSRSKKKGRDPVLGTAALTLGLSAALCGGLLRTLTTHCEKFANLSWGTY